MLPVKGLDYCASLLQILALPNGLTCFAPDIYGKLLGSLFISHQISKAVKETLFFAISDAMCRKVIITNSLVDIRQ